MTPLTVSAHAGPAVAVALLVVVQVLNNRLARRAYLVTSLAAAALLLVVARLAGLSWADVGVATGGGRWAPVLVVLTACGYLILALLPATRALFLDRRVAEVRAGPAAYQMLVHIPLGTVVPEEIAFRGVLLGLLTHAYGTVWAVVVTSLLFGLWHVVPSRELPELNAVARRTTPALVVPGAVLGTTLAGALLCGIRLRSGGLVAPVALHWAANALAYLTAVLVTRRRPVGRRP